MLALVLDDGPHLISDYPEPSPSAAEALIRVRLAGICATDLELVHGYQAYRGVLGHEFVGEVAAADDQTWIGRRVVGEINIGCGTCALCLQGIPSQCLDRKAVGIHKWGGAFAELMILPYKNLHPIPDDLPDEMAVFVEPLAAALQALALTHVRPGDQVGVVGDGKLGLLVAQVLATTGAQVSVVGRHPEKLALAAGWGMATFIKNPPRMLDVVAECTGNPQGLATALQMVRPRGAILLKSTCRGQANINLTRVVVKEIRLVGSRCGPFRPAIQLLQSGQINVGSLIEARYPLQDGWEALKHAGRRGALKVLIQP